MRISLAFALIVLLSCAAFAVPTKVVNTHPLVHTVDHLVGQIRQHEKFEGPVAGTVTTSGDVSTFKQKIDGDYRAALDDDASCLTAATELCQWGDGEGGSYGNASNAKHDYKLMSGQACGAACDTNGAFAFVVMMK